MSKSKRPKNTNPKDTNILILVIVLVLVIAVFFLALLKANKLRQKKDLLIQRHKKLCSLIELKFILKKKIERTANIIYRLTIVTLFIVLVLSFYGLSIIGLVTFSFGGFLEIFGFFSLLIAAIILVVYGKIVDYKEVVILIDAYVKYRTYKWLKHDKITTSNERHKLELMEITREIEEIDKQLNELATPIPK